MQIDGQNWLEQSSNMKNNLFEPGDIVRYSPIIGERPALRTYKVSEIGRIGNNQVVAWLEGKLGCVSMDALTLIENTCQSCEGECEEPYTCPHCRHVRPCGDGSHCQNCYRCNDPDDPENTENRNLDAK